ncbi:MAG: hypothetical protein A2066_12925 [Bacteroidetes bacterium GWB2_41_8]|nr:MAG: hypothetical protein A2066_12925 [Bacteroidetes bacterium GWB2_41_8]
MRAITVKQPWAYLICSGKKDIENRTWYNMFRGRVLIHASAKPVKMINPNNVFTYQQWESFSTEEQVQLICSGTSFKPLQNSSIIGSVEIVDCVVNHESIWAEKSELVIGENKVCQPQTIYNWVLDNPIMFPEPIPAKGKLSFWDYPGILAEPEEKDGPLFCHCQLPVKEQSQVSACIDQYRCNYCGGIWYK